MTTSHPLAWGTVTSHPWRDCVESSQAEGEALDLRVAALTAVLVPSLAAEAELRSLAREISAAAGREVFGGQGAGLVLAWRAQQLGTIRAAALRLGYAPDGADGLDIR